MSRVSRGLAQKGHQITIVSTQIVRVQGCKSITLGFSLPILPVLDYLPNEFNRKSVWKMGYKEAQGVIKVVTRTLRPLVKRFDMIFAHHVNITSIIAQRLGEEYNIPVVTMVHGSELKRWKQIDQKLQNEIKGSLIKTEGIMIPSDAIATQLKEQIPALLDENLIVIPCVDYDTQLLPILEEFFLSIKEFYQPPKERPFYQTLTERSLNVLIFSLLMLKKQGRYVKNELLNMMEKEK
ncbi:MAG: glycosyltransferase family 4 protein [Promethearchaeota archaeon]